MIGPSDNRGQADFFMRGGLHPELVFHSFLQSLITALRCPPQLASMELDLHEKRLTAFAVGPIMVVIHVDAPIEVVVGLAPFVSGGGHAAKIESFESASDAGEVSRFLKKHRDGADSIGQLDTVLALPLRWWCEPMEFWYMPVIREERNVEHTGEVA